MPEKFGTHERGFHPERDERPWFSVKRFLGLELGQVNVNLFLVAKGP